MSWMLLLRWFWAVRVWRAEKGRIVGTLIGALILGFLNNGLNLLGVSSYYQMIVKAVVILLAVLVDNKKAVITTTGHLEYEHEKNWLPRFPLLR